MRRNALLLGCVALLVAASCAPRRAPRVSAPPPPEASAAAPGEILVREQFRGPGQPRGGRIGLGYLGRNLIVSDNDAQRTIIDVEAETYAFADKGARQYWVIPLPELFRRFAALEQYRREAWDDERRERPDMGPWDGEGFAFEATGRTDRIAGHPAREYRAQGGRKEGSVWVADDIPAPREARRFEELAAASGQLDLAKTPLAPAIPGIEGLVLRGMLTVGDGEQRRHHARFVLEVRPTPPPPDLLAIPRGYRQVLPPPPPGA